LPLETVGGFNGGQIKLDGWLIHAAPLRIPLVAENIVITDNAKTTIGSMRSARHQRT